MVTGSCSFRDPLLSVFSLPLRWGKVGVKGRGENRELNGPAVSSSPLDLCPCGVYLVPGLGHNRK